MSVSVKYNDRLHGKAYLLYDGNEGKGCIITSGNFTDNGLKNNYEYGVFLDNESMQEKLRNQIYRIVWSELSYEEVILLIGELWTYLANLNEQVEERLDLIIEQIKAAEGVNEELKTRNQLE